MTLCCACLCDKSNDYCADGVPYDGVPQNVTETIHVAVTGIFSILSTCGIVFAISCMLFNFIYRHRK